MVLMRDINQRFRQKSGDEDKSVKMAAVFGKIDSFEDSKEIWERYCERLGHYFIANGIGDTEEAEKKTAAYFAQRVWQ